MSKRYYYCETSNGKFLGRLLSTEAELRSAFICAVHANGLCVVFGLTEAGKALAREDERKQARARKAEAQARARKAEAQARATTQSTQRGTRTASNAT